MLTLSSAIGHQTVRDIVKAVTQDENVSAGNLRVVRKCQHVDVAWHHCMTDGIRTFCKERS